MLPSSVRSRGGFSSPRTQGGWINLAIAGISALAGAAGKRKAKKQADADRARSAAVEGKQLYLAQQQENRAGKLFEHYERNFQPREAEFVKEAFTPITPEAEEARAVADVRGSLATARRGDEQRRRSMGVNPASGQAASLDAARSLEEAKIEGAARARARSGVRDLNFDRQRSALAIANPGAAVPFSSTAASGYGQVGSLAARRSAMSDDLAYEGGAAYGRGVGEVVDAGLQYLRNRPWRGAQPQPQPIYTAGPNPEPIPGT